MSKKSKKSIVKPLSEAEAERILNKPLTRSSGVLQEKAQTTELKTVKKFAKTIRNKQKDVTSNKNQQGSEIPKICTKNKALLKIVDKPRYDVVTRKQKNKETSKSVVDEKKKAIVTIVAPKKVLTSAREIAKKGENAELHKIVEKFTEVTKKRKHEDSTFVEPEKREKHLQLMTSAFKCNKIRLNLCKVKNSI